MTGAVTGLRDRLIWLGIAVVSAVFLVVFTLHATRDTAERVVVLGALVGVWSVLGVTALLRRRWSSKRPGERP